MLSSWWEGSGGTHLSPLGSDQLWPHTKGLTPRWATEDRVHVSNSAAQSRLWSQCLARIQATTWAFGHTHCLKGTCIIRTIKNLSQNNLPSFFILIFTVLCYILHFIQSAWNCALMIIFRLVLQKWLICTKLNFVAQIEYSTYKE